MTVFNFTLLVNDPLADVVSAALGVDAANGYAEVDIGKGVKLGTASNYVPLVATEEIEGVVVALSPETVNDGFSFGSVQKNRRVKATVGANQAGAIAMGALVVADTPIALGTAGDLEVVTGVPTTWIWRVVAVVSGTGVTGDVVIIERT